MADVWTLLTSSLLLWWLTGTLLWAFIGGLVGSGTGLPVWVGLLAGGAGWFVGAAAVLTVGLLRRSGRPSSVSVSPAAAASGGMASSGAWVEPWAVAQTADPWGAGHPADPWGVAAHPGPTGDPLPVAGADRTTGPSTGRRGSVRLPGGGAPRWVGATAGVAGLVGGTGLAASAVFAWVTTVVTAPDAAGVAGDTGWGPGDSALVAVALIASSVTAAVCGVLGARRLRGRYLILMMLVVVPWFTLAVQVLIAVDSTDGVGALVTVVSQGQFGARVHSAAGIWCAFAGSVIAIVGAVASAGSLITSRRPRGVVG